MIVNLKKQFRKLERSENGILRAIERCFRSSLKNTRNQFKKKRRLQVEGEQRAAPAKVATIARIIELGSIKWLGRSLEQELYNNPRATEKSRAGDCRRTSKETMEKPQGRETKNIELNVLEAPGGRQRALEEGPGSSTSYIYIYKEILGEKGRLCEMVREATRAIAPLGWPSLELPI